MRTPVGVVGALLLTGCGTIFGSGPDLVPVSSEPNGAIVTLDGVQLGRTPCVVPVARRSSGLLVIEAEGGRARNEVQLENVPNRACWANGLGLLPGVVIGTTVDAIAGNLTKWAESPVYVKLPAPVQQ